MEGPIREEIFELNLKKQLLKKFMQGEGYEEKDINEAVTGEKQRQA